MNNAQTLEIPLNVKEASSHLIEWILISRKLRTMLKMQSKEISQWIQCFIMLNESKVEDYTHGIESINSKTIKRGPDIAKLTENLIN